MKFFQIELTEARVEHLKKHLLSNPTDGDIRNILQSIIDEELDDWIGEEDEKIRT